MKGSNRHLPLIVLALLLNLVLAPDSASARQSAVSFASLNLDHAAALVLTDDGLEVLEMRSGTAYLPVSFTDGVLEVDIAPSQEFVFGGFVFRAESHTDAEEIYVRLNKSGLPDAVQYAPRRNGLTEWQLHSGKGFTAPARFSRTEWIRLKAEIDGQTARFFVDDDEVFVARLQREPTAGSIGLYGIYGARFANFTYTHATAPVNRLAPETETGPVDPNMISDWQISRVHSAEPDGPDPGALMAGETDWLPVVADTSGIVNIGKYRTKADAGGGDALVFARTVISSDGAQTRRLAFGYSDEVTIYLNGRPLFEGNSRWRARDPMFLGTIGLHDHVYLDLEDGDNELVLAVTEWFGGWGAMARLD